MPVSHPASAQGARGRAANAALLQFPLFFIALSVLRGWRMAEGLGTYTSCHDCFWVPTFGHDAWLLAALLGILAASCLTPWRPIAFGLRLLAGLVLLFFAVDMALDSLLSQRLFLGDILRVGKHIDADSSVIVAGIASFAGMSRIAILAVAAVIAVCLCGSVRPNRRHARWLAIAAVIAGLFSAWALSRPVRYVNQLHTWNVVESNLPQGRIKTFSPAFMASQRRIADTIPRTCDRAPSAYAGNVVVLMVESLSSWHSQLLGSPFDWTPNLDAIARDNHYFTDFHANGFTTGGAEISIITGNPSLIPDGSNFFTLATWSALPDSLADVAHASGREAGFFTTGDLAFLGVGEWLRNMNFDIVNGHDDPFYGGMRRWQFGAADDAALFDRYLDWMDRRTDPRPFLSVLLTVSTHPPFVDPASAKIDPERAFRYADAQIGRFHAQLEQRGFFEDGILLILGDHRTMTPLRKHEYRAFGERAFSRIPMVVAGAVDMPAVVDAPFQQTDIRPSIAELFGLESCTSPFVGRFLRAQPQPPAYVVHARGDDRNRVDVYWGDKEISAFHYDGDDSTWPGVAPPEPEVAAAWINTHRIRTAPAAATRQD